MLSQDLRHFTYLERKRTFPIDDIIETHGRYVKEMIKDGEEGSEEESSDYVLLGNKLPQFRGGSYRLNLAVVRWACEEFPTAMLIIHLTDGNDTKPPMM